MSAVRLAPLGVPHLEGLSRLVADPDVQRYTRIPSPPPADFARTWLGRYDDGRRDGTREGFAIVDDRDGAFLGIAVAARIEREARSAELGYIVDRGARGRGVASQALLLLTEWGFAALGALRLELYISVENEPSKRVAERCGYRREGVLRSVYVKPGLREDTEIWSRLPSDG